MKKRMFDVGCLMFDVGRNAKRSTSHIYKILNVPLLCALCVFAVIGCTSPERPKYNPDRAGAGAVRYSPERGVYREGESLNDSEEALYQRALASYTARDYKNAAIAFASLTQSYPDGSRAFDAVILEAVSLLEAGRKTPTPWMLDDLADAMNEGDPAAIARLPAEFLKGDQTTIIREIARELDDAGAIEESSKKTRDIFRYYGAGFGPAPEQHLRVARHARNLAWFAWQAGNNRLAQDIASDLVERVPQRSIRTTTLLVLADTYLSIGYYDRSREAYNSVYADRGAPAALRERALLGETRSVRYKSKGPQYDLKTWETALQKIAEYKQDFLGVYPSPLYKDRFAELEREIHDVLIGKELAAAHTYDRFFEPEAAVFHRGQAEKLQAKFMKQETLLSGPNPRAKKDEPPPANEPTPLEKQ